MEVLATIDSRMAKRARGAAAWLQEQHAQGRRVTVVHHIDADGVTSGAIALEALARAGIAHDSVAAKSLDDVHIAAVQNGGHAALWFCDFGSTAYMHFDNKLVCDHHQLVRDGTEEDFPHVNPLLDEMSGSEISGAGCAYLVAEALDAANQDLLPLALIGATADLQTRDGFQGMNGDLLAAAVACGLANVQEDLAFFGPETRDLRRFLAYADVTIPGATGSGRDAEAFLVQLGFDAKGTYASLDAAQKEILRSALVDRLLDCDLPLEGLTRAVVSLPNEEAGPTRELQEFGTLLNSTARYDEPAIGLAVARGDRDEAFQKALSLRNDHKRHLGKSLDALMRRGITETPALQWVHMEDDVRDTVVGIVCGMALESLANKPLIGFAHTVDGRTKVSSRAPKALQGRVDLATAMREGSAVVGGQGGGHTGAAGATIPRGSESEFLASIEAIIGTQLGVATTPVETGGWGQTAGQTTLW